MDHLARILVVYASRTGCTREAAEIIGEVLRTKLEAEVDVRPVQDARSLSGYEAVVAGSAARSKRGWLSEARRWLRAHQAELARMPVAYFMTCWVLRNDTPEAGAEAQDYVELVRQKFPAITPLAVGLFPGRLDLSRFSAFDRFFLRMKHAPAGNWFSGERVRRWAEELPAALRF
jgi:menaquinone-dependent protoporphyrinogen oxidase